MRFFLSFLLRPKNKENCRSCRTPKVLGKEGKALKTARDSLKREIQTGAWQTGAWPERRQLGRKGPFQVDLCSSPVAVRCGGIGPVGPEKAPIGPGKALISPERPDFPGSIWGEIL